MKKKFLTMLALTVMTVCLFAVSAFAMPGELMYVNNTNGTGVNMPTGILAETGGADIGMTANALTYDDVIRLYFSAKPEYRRNGVWLMNDETALMLRSLKDNSGQYL